MPPIQTTLIDRPETMSRRFNDDEVENPGTGNREARVVLKVKDPQDGSEVYFNIRRSTKLKKLMNAYCFRQGQKFVSFVLDWRLLRGDETADQLEVEEDDEITAIVHETLRDQVKYEEKRNALIGVMAKIGRMISERIAENRELKEEVTRLWNDGEEDGGVFLMIGRLVCVVIKENVELKEEIARLLFEEDEEYDDIDDDELEEDEDIGRLVTELVGWEKLVGGPGEKKLNLFSRL